MARRPGAPTLMRIVPALASMTGETSRMLAWTSCDGSETGATSTSSSGRPSRKNASKTSNTASRGPSVGEREGRLRRRHHLPSFHAARRDDAVCRRFQLGVGERVLSRGERRLGGLERSLCTQQLLLCIVKDGPWNSLRLQERLCSIERQRLLCDDGLRRLQCRAGDADVRLLFGIIEPRQNVAGVNMRSDVDPSLQNPAADAKGKFGLNSCLHLAGDFRTRLILSLRRRNDADLLRRRRHFGFVFAGSQNCAGETTPSNRKDCIFCSGRVCEESRIVDRLASICRCQAVARC